MLASALPLYIQRHLFLKNFFFKKFIWSSSNTGTTQPHILCPHSLLAPSCCAIMKASSLCSSLGISQPSFAPRAPIQDLPCRAQYSLQVLPELRRHTAKIFYYGHIISFRSPLEYWGAQISTRKKAQTKCASYHLVEILGCPSVYLLYITQSCLNNSCHFQAK